MQQSPSSPTESCDYKKEIELLRTQLALVQNQSHPVVTRRLAHPNLDKFCTLMCSAGNLDKIMRITVGLLRFVTVGGVAPRLGDIHPLVIAGKKWYGALDDYRVGIDLLLWAHGLNGILNDASSDPAKKALSIFNNTLYIGMSISEWLFWLTWVSPEFAKYSGLDMMKWLGHLCQVWLVIIVSSFLMDVLEFRQLRRKLRRSYRMAEDTDRAALKAALRDCGLRTAKNACDLAVCLCTMGVPLLSSAKVGLAGAIAGSISLYRTWKSA